MISSSAVRTDAKVDKPDQRQLMLNTHDSVMSCLEHQRLSRADFKYSKDFDYLLKHELPCFSIEVKQGQISLVVSHYLAKVVLPSGLSLEILPKIVAAKPTSKSLSKRSSKPATSDDITAIKPNNQELSYAQSNQSNYDNSWQVQVIKARKWVATMLKDIGTDNLAKTIPAVTLSQQSTYKATDNQCLYSQVKGLPFDQTINLNEPWYEGVLARINHILHKASTSLPNRYQTQVNNRPKAQGKINLSAQLKKNWHRPHYLYTEQAVFETDNLLAEFLVTAWQQLQKVSQCQTTVQAQTKLHAQTTVQAQPKAIATAASRSKPKPMQQLPINLHGNLPLAPKQWAMTYQTLLSNKHSWRSQFSVAQLETITQAIEWGWWLLNQGSHEQTPKDYDKASADGLPVPAVMINMNYAFERWVLGKLDKWVSANLSSSKLIIKPSFDWLYYQSEPSRSSLKETVIQKLIPDACIVCDAGTVSHVIDIKYKTINNIADVSGADWQQLYSYQKRLNCLNAWLIYPRTINFTERLDVIDKLKENRQSNQMSVDNVASNTDIEKMSVIPFDPYQSLLLI
ncbi:hypothetical protein [Psychrobacter sp.]|uniref:5-methylcytosine restriction system specificity protein McrC n=1 Tax=Psychrobacter sp. TaxID=56811 RepID=UPI0025EB9EF7|nr:hypothetical protein [Psychrobacter sp.]